MNERLLNSWHLLLLQSPSTSKAMWSEQQIGAGPSFIHNYTHTHTHTHTFSHCYSPPRRSWAKNVSWNLLHHASCRWKYIYYSNVTIWYSSLLVFTEVTDLNIVAQKKSHLWSCSWMTCYTVKSRKWYGTFHLAFFWKPNFHSRPACMCMDSYFLSLSLSLSSFSGPPMGIRKFSFPSSYSVFPYNGPSNAPLLPKCERISAVLK